MFTKSIFVTAAMCATVSLAQAQQGGATTQSSTGTATEQTTSNSVAAEAQSLTFNTLLTASGLDRTLQGDYTIFAPSNDALATVQTDTTAAGKEKLAKLLSSHIVKGKYSSKDLAKAIATGKGEASLTNLAGEKITFKVNENKNLEVSDSHGNSALATNFDKESPRGTVHVIDKPLAP